MPRKRYSGRYSPKTMRLRKDAKRMVTWARRDAAKLGRKDEVLGSRLLVISIIIVAAVTVVILASYQAPAAAPVAPGPEKPAPKRTVPVSVPANISFSEVMRDYERMSGDSVTLTGFLENRVQRSMGSGAMGIYTYLLVDDSGGEINLTGLTERQKTQFVREGMTPGLFNVTGVIKARFGSFDFEVTGIAQAQRQYVTVMVETG